MGLIRVRHLARERRGETPRCGPVHAHGEGQLFLVRAGLVSVSTGGGRWFMPPGHLGWVPPHTGHGAFPHEGLDASSLYFDEGWSRACMPGDVRVVRANPLLTGLLDALAAPDRLSPRAHGLYAAVFADAFARVAAEEMAQSLFLPMPRDARLLALASALIRQPDDDGGLDDLARRAGMSRRTLTRRFQAETGWSLGRWRQQMRLLAALDRLAQGASVTAVALDMGYRSVSAFIAMFRACLGMSPKAWLARAGTPHGPAWPYWRQAG